MYLIGYNLIDKLKKSNLFEIARHLSTACYKQLHNYERRTTSTHFPHYRLFILHFHSQHTTFRPHTI